MAALVSKVKDKIHRRSGSSHYDNGDDEHGGSARVNTRSTIPPTAQGPTHVSLEHSAFHVHQGSAARKSFESPVASDSVSDQTHPQKPLPNLPSSSSRIAEHTMPERASPKHDLTERSRNKSTRDTGSNNSGAVDGPVPARDSSNQAFGRNERSGGESNVTIHRKPVLNVGSSPGQASHRSKSPMPIFDETSDEIRMFDSQDDGSEQLAAAMKNLSLPEGFSLQNSEQTTVTEEWRPAVTHETIIKQRTEIIREEITRDIHVHHYYTYQQPIRVVEILPAKHFWLDPNTGVKTQVLTPEGYEMPINLTPSSPDTSMVKGWTRDYLVNEQHPNGVLEHSRLKHEPDVDNLRAVVTS